MYKIIIIIRLNFLQVKMGVNYLSEIYTNITRAVVQEKEGMLMALPSRAYEFLFTNMFVWQKYVGEFAK